MKIKFYDPISGKWVTPRTDPEPAQKGWMEVLAENAMAAENAALEAAKRERDARIWAITRQVAEGCNAPATPVSEPASGECGGGDTIAHVPVAPGEVVQVYRSGGYKLVEIDPTADVEIYPGSAAPDPATGGFVYSPHEHIGVWAIKSSPDGSIAKKFQPEWNGALSCDRRWGGYDDYQTILRSGGDVRVMVDGEEVKDCVAADTIMRTVIRLDGSFQIGGEVKLLVVEGVAPDESRNGLDRCRAQYSNALNFRGWDSEQKAERKRHDRPLLGRSTGVLQS